MGKGPALSSDMHKVLFEGTKVLVPVYSCLLNHISKAGTDQCFQGSLSFPAEAGCPQALHLLAHGVLSLAETHLENTKSGDNFWSESPLWSYIPILGLLKG